MESALDGEIQEAMHDGDASPSATVLRQYCDAANLTGGLQAPCANRVTFCGSGPFESEDMVDDGVEIVPFVAFRDLLFFDENSSPHVLDVHAVVLPRGQSHDVILRVIRGHAGLPLLLYVKRSGPAQTSRASRAARPMYVAGVRALRRAFSAGGIGKPSTNFATAGPSMRRPRVRAFSCS